MEAADNRDRGDKDVSRGGTRIAQSICGRRNSAPTDCLIATNPSGYKALVCRFLSRNGANMTGTCRTNTSKYVIDRAGLDLILDGLAQLGYTLIGPRVRDHAVVYSEIHSTRDMPIGMHDEQEGGRYRLRCEDHEPSLFDYVVGPTNWKRFLFPPREAIVSITRNGHAMEFEHVAPPPPKMAFIGVRPCDLAAISRLDAVFVGGQYVDLRYQARRQNLFVLAVNCARPGGTCFCASMGTGPRATTGFDLAITEIRRPHLHEFIVTIGTSRGEDVLRTIPHHAAGNQAIELEEATLASATEHMGITFDSRNIQDVLYRHYENRQWDDVATRCMACGNCTLVCPTCFCSTVEDDSDLTGNHAERRRAWDSCFTSDFSYIHGGAVRPSIRSRYRQWMLHKLATWHDQFDASGCVGCGRCITWCPVGIDITKEAGAIRASETRETATAGTTGAKS